MKDIYLLVTQILIIEMPVDENTLGLAVGEIFSERIKARIALLQRPINGFLIQTDRIGLGISRCQRCAVLLAHMVQGCLSAKRLFPSIIHDATKIKKLANITKKRRRDFSSVLLLQMDFLT